MKCSSITKTKRAARRFTTHTKHLRSKNSMHTHFVRLSKNEFRTYCTFRVVVAFRVQSIALMSFLRVLIFKTHCNPLSFFLRFVLMMFSFTHFSLPLGFIFWCLYLGFQSLKMWMYDESDSDKFWVWYGCRIFIFLPSFIKRAWRAFQTVVKESQTKFHAFRLHAFPFKRKHSLLKESTLSSIIAYIVLCIFIVNIAE